MKFANKLSVSSVGYPLALAALASLSFAPAIAAAADSSDATPDEISADSVYVSNQASNAQTASTKDETVYVYTTADGDVKSQEVSAKLGNPDEAAEISDSSTLKDIENVEGDETYSGIGSDMVWNANGGNIYYRGTTDAAIPVQVKVSYKLDGKSVSGADLAGKSGHVTIRYDYVNNSTQTVKIGGKDEKVATPFVAVTGMLLDNDVFSNVKVENGKLVDDGDRSVALGYAMPGLAASLDMDEEDFEIPEYFEVQADVTDFELKSTLTMVSPNLLEGFDLDFDTDELSDASSALKDAMSELEDGTDQLADGLKQMAEAVRTAKDGTGKLADGTGKLATGAKKVSTGLGSLKSNTAALPGGVTLLYTYTNQLAGALDKAAAGVGSASDKSDKTLVGGTNLLLAGIGTAKDTGNDTLLGGMNQIESGLGDAAEAAKAADSYASKVADGNLAEELQALAAAGSSLSTSGNEVLQGAGELKEDLSSSLTEVVGAVGGLSTPLDDAQNAIEGIRVDSTSVDAAKSEIDNVNLDDLGLDSGTITTIRSRYSNAANKIENVTVDSSTVDTAKAKIQSAKSAASTTASGIGSKANSLSSTLDSQLDSLKGKMGAMSSALSALSKEDATQTLVDLAKAQGYIEGLDAGLQKLEAGATALKISTSTKVLPGVQGVKVGLLKLADSKEGLPAAASGAHDIADNISTLKDKMPSLVKGVDQLASGSKQVSTGISTVDENMSKLDGGLSQLLEAMEKASDGSGQLADGMKQFDEEGISEITDLIDDKLLKYLDRFDAVTQAGKDYQNFSGITEGTEGSVKFVYETDAIEVE